MQALLPRLHCFQEGTCVVHHLFGAEVSEMVKAAYGDAFLTAHLEVSHLALMVTGYAVLPKAFWPSWHCTGLHRWCLPLAS